MDDERDGKTLERPRQVSLAGWVIIGASVAVVAGAWQQISSLGTLETREAIESFLSEPPGDGLDLGVSGAVSIVRALSMITAACAAAAAILGWHVMQRSKSARLALTVLAVPLFLSGLVLGGFLSALVAAGAVTLWFSPARYWFDGRTPPQPAPAAVPQSQPQSRPLSPPPSAGPVAYHDYGRPAPTVTAPVRHEQTRPAPLATALMLTWGACLLTLVGLVLLVTTLALDPTMLDEGIEEAMAANPEAAAQVSTETVRAAVFVMLGGLGVWTLAAAVLAGLAWRRHTWAWVCLLVSAGLAIACFLLSVLASLMMLIPLAVTMGTFSLLLRPEVRAWYQR